MKLFKNNLSCQRFARVAETEIRHVMSGRIEGDEEMQFGGFGEG